MARPSLHFPLLKVIQVRSVERIGWAEHAARACALVLAFAAVASALGAVSEGFDLLNHFTPALALAALALAALATTRRAYRLSLLLVASAGLAATTPRLWGECGGQVQGRAAGPTVTLLTQNLWNENPDPQATAAALVAAHADVVVMQELSGRGKATAELVERAYAYKADCTINRWCTLAIASRWPIVAWSYHQGAWKPPIWDRLVMDRATIEAPGLGRFDVVASKLVHPYAPARMQVQQRNLLAAALARMPSPASTILAGDFNLTPWSFALRRLDARLPITRRTHGLVTWPNRLPWASNPWPVPFPFLPIDQVYAGSSWVTVAVRRGPRTGSDHYGAIVTLAPAQATSRH